MWRQVARVIRVTALALGLGIVVATAAAAGLAPQGGEWTARALGALLPGGEQQEEGDVRLVGRILERDDQDADGNPITRAFLQREDDESLIPLPCERRDGDAGALARAAGNALADEPSCWDFLGERVEIIGTVQSIEQGARRFRRLARIGSIALF